MRSTATMGALVRAAAMLLPALLTACAKPPTATMPAAAPSAAVADTVYTGGDVLTMAGPEPVYVEALLVRDGKIAFVGSKVDLKGKTLLPGFIDGHGHMINYGKNLVDANLVGSKDIVDVLARMKAHVATVDPDEWIVGFGYSVPQLAEKRHPTVEELGAISPGRPIMVVDGSGHVGAGNSTVFKRTGFSADSKDPAGGTFKRKADGKSLAGPMEETALFAVREKPPAFTGKLADDVAIGGAKAWASYGQTTAQEFGVGIGSDDIGIIRNAIDKNLLPIDLYRCAKDTETDKVVTVAQETARDFSQAEGAGAVSVNEQQDLVAAGAAAPGNGASLLLAARPDLDKRYISRVRLGGIEFWLDGSLPTAWMTQPYTNNPPGTKGPIEPSARSLTKRWSPRSKSTGRRTCRSTCT